ncbi:hypothetical protein VQ02_23550 [Methylobacterium variabile]|jgi:hypothetical protein|uniref:Uncharacterized protein n=1 Tax=Methylobacterium variabile TaxID=298794 RepID=A0A0J6SGK1_9HYPH|nr:hypothetical protein [Methylobacterium variabile]KMO32473.1 hypothetical protein VQ02_23550 [Methylobacterium variabile]
MKTTFAFVGLMGLLGLALAGPAVAQEALDITVSPRATPLDPPATGSVRPVRPNPNVTPSNPMGVVGFDGPPGGTTSVIGDDGPLPPGSPAATPDATFARP